MAAQAGNPVDPSTNPHVISGAFVQQYYHILHEQPEEAFKFYQDSSILGRPDSNGTMVSVTTLGGINEKIMSMDFRNCLTKIDTADPQLSHKDGVLIVVTGSLTSHEGLCRRFTQSFFLAPQESGGYFVLNDVFRFISDRQQDEINQAVTQENESSQNVVSASQTCLTLPEPTPAGKSLISDHVTVEDTVKEEQVINPAVTGTTVEKNASAKPHVQVAKADPRKGRVAPPPIQTDVAKKSYASVVKIMKDGPPAPPDAKPPPPDAKPTPSVAKHKSAPKPVTKAVEDQEKSSAKPTQANESDGNVAENNSSHNEQCYSVYIKRVPFHATIQMVEEEFKKFGAIKPGAIQLVRNLDDRFCFGFIEYESQKSMQSAIEASPVLMGRKEVYVEQKRTPTRVVNGRGVYHGDNFSGRGGGYADNASYRGDENFNHRNDGNNFNRRNDSENYNRRNDRENYNRGRTDGENYNRGRNDGENYNRGRTDGENYNRGRNDGENYNRGRNDGENYNRGRNDGENYNRGRNDGENYNRRNDRENYNHGRTDFNRRNDGENYNRSRSEGESYSRSRNDGESYIRRNDNENFNHRNNGEDFNRRNEFSGRGRGPPPPGNGYQHNGNGFPSRPFQNGNGRPARVSGPKQSQDAA
ncbi:hypothetical protein ACP70R_046426 [Stipagrostis hirtigluma subsp. patula]